MTTDLFGRTPEEAERAMRKMRKDNARIMARDWREVPRGYYAIPVTGWIAWSETCEGDPPVVGYRLFERRTARRCENGRVIGRDRFITGAVMGAPGADPAAVRDEIASDQEVHRDLGPHGDLQRIVDSIILDTRDGDTFRAKFGQLTGKCGCCGRRLTDPRSKLIGIGPDCRGYR